MVFPESILVCQPTRAKALNPTHTQLKIASSISRPYLWRREREACTVTSANGSQGSWARPGPARTPELKASLCLGSLCLPGSEWGRVQRSALPDVSACAA